MSDQTTRSAQLAQEFNRDAAACRTLLQDNPWLIPATLALEAIPLTVMIHGFWKTRQLKKQLQIERERTKQLHIQRFTPGLPRPLKQPHA